MNVSELLRDPYPGLRSFDRNETHLFFGRESVVNVMVDRLAAHRFLTVVGASGSGNASLGRTGLLDALERGLMADAGSEWMVAALRPGHRPLFALAEAVIEATGARRGENDVLPREAMLARGPYGLVEWLRELELSPRTNLLLLVDQFEEIFRYRQGAERDEVAAFVPLLLASAAQRKQRIYVVITMRSDFIGDCAEFPGLAEAINDGQFLTPRLTREQCQQAIEGPAAVCGGKIETALVNRLLNDMGTNPDQLPLMQHALMRLWNTARARAASAAQTGPMLMLDDYEKMGGLGVPEGLAQQLGDVAAARFKGALSGHADEIFADLTEEQQHLAGILFRALTEGEGAGGRDVRRPVTLREAAAVAGVSPEAMYPVVDAFRAAGRNLLMPPPQVSLTAETVIDISHESLIRQWSMLRDWVREEAEAAATYRRLEATAKLWHVNRAELWRRRDLDQAPWREPDQRNAAWAARYGDAFELAMQFLDASLQAERRREAASRASTQRQIRTRYVLAGVLGAATIAMITAIVLYRERQVAELNFADADRNFRSAATASRETIELFLSEYGQGKFPELTETKDFLREPAQLLKPGAPESDDVDHARLHLFAAFSKIDLAEGKADAALALACAQRDVAARRATAHSSDLEQQRDLADSYATIGDALQITARPGAIAQALTAYQNSRDIVERIAGKIGDPRPPDLDAYRGRYEPCENTGDPWPYTYGKESPEQPPNADDFTEDSAVAHENIGDMLRAGNQLSEAAREYQKEVALANTALPPGLKPPGDIDLRNRYFRWKRDLALGLEGLGDVQWLQGDYPGALDKFSQYQKVVEDLVDSDPSNGAWQRDMAIADQRLGDVLRSMHRLESARQHFETCRSRKVNSYNERNNWPKDVQEYCRRWDDETAKEIAELSSTPSTPSPTSPK